VIVSSKQNIWKEEQGERNRKGMNMKKKKQKIKDLNEKASEKFVP
jgi:hypothetical protein